MSLDQEQATRTRWWRRNAVALVLVVVLGTATVWITSAREWRDHFEFLPTQPVSGAPGEPVSLGSVGYTLTDLRRVPVDDLPEGIVALIATIDVAPATPEEVPLGCMVALDETDGSHDDRSWSAEAFSSIEVPMSADTTTICSSDAVGDYTLEMPFFVPDDVDGTLTLTIEVGAEAPRYVAIEVGSLPEP